MEISKSCTIKDCSISGTIVNDNAECIIHFGSVVGTLGGITPNIINFDASKLVYDPNKEAFQSFDKNGYIGKVIELAN